MKVKLIKVKIFLFFCYIFGDVFGDEVEIVDSAFKRIVGGVNGNEGQFPYSVSLRHVSNLAHFCGGFIMTEKWIGTAAHCTKGKQPSKVVVVVGEIQVIRSLSDTENTIPLEKLVNHPEYDAHLLKNDIALIKTLRKIKFSPKVEPVRLGSFVVKENVEAIIAGFGYVTYPGKASKTIKYANAITISNEECKSMMTKANAAKIFDNNICTISNDVNESGTCLGDSGSALVQLNGVLIGITSWGVPCALGYPDVYTRIEYYHDWIDSVIDF